MPKLLKQLFHSLRTSLNIKLYSYAILPFFFIACSSSISESEYTSLPVTPMPDQVIGRLRDAITNFPIENLKITLKYNGISKVKSTNSYGIISFNGVPLNTQVIIKSEKYANYPILLIKAYNYNGVIFDISLPHSSYSPSTPGTANAKIYVDLVSNDIPLDSYIIGIAATNLHGYEHCNVSGAIPISIMPDVNYYISAYTTTGTCSIYSPIDTLVYKKDVILEAGSTSLVELDMANNTNQIVLSGTTGGILDVILENKVIASWINFTSTNFAITVNKEDWQDEIILRSQISEGNKASISMKGPFISSEYGISFSYLPYITPSYSSGYLIMASSTSYSTYKTLIWDYATEGLEWYVLSYTNKIELDISGSFYAKSYAYDIDFSSFLSGNISQVYDYSYTVWQFQTP